MKGTVKGAAVRRGFVMGLPHRRAALAALLALPHVVGRALRANGTNVTADLVDARTAWWAAPYRTCDEDVYLSVVMVGRNDDYGGTFQKRLEVSLALNLDALNGAAARNGAFSAEVVYVDWNPIADGPTSYDLLGAYAANAARAGATNATTRVRVVTVPPAVHDGIRALFVARGFPASGSWPKVIEYFGKNVGVRRSRGAFVLATNPDDVFHRKLVQSFGLAKLAKIHFYRAQRTHCAKWGPLQKGPSRPATASPRSAPRTGACRPSGTRRSGRARAPARAAASTLGSTRTTPKRTRASRSRGPSATRPATSGSCTANCGTPSAATSRRA